MNFQEWVEDFRKQKSVREASQMLRAELGRRYDSKILNKLEDRIERACFQAVSYDPDESFHLENAEAVRSLQETTKTLEGFLKYLTIKGKGRRVLSSAIFSTFQDLFGVNFQAHMPDLYHRKVKYKEDQVEILEFFLSRLKGNITRLSENSLNNHFGCIAYPTEKKTRMKKDPAVDSLIFEIALILQQPGSTEWTCLTVPSLQGNTRIKRQTEIISKFLNATLHLKYTPAKVKDRLDALKKAEAKYVGWESSYNNSLT